MNETNVMKLIAAAEDAISDLDTYSVEHDDIFNDEIGRINDLLEDIKRSTNE